jgi:hypothetical protein
MNILKPCPFCGGRAYHNDREPWFNVKGESTPSRGHYIECISCKAGTGLMYGKSASDDVTAKWNTRMETEQTVNAIVGWNACRQQVFSLCEYYQEQSDDGCPDRFMEGQRYTAKHIAKAMNSFEAVDCDILIAATGGV